MIQLNRYLRELGIDEKNWLFNKENKENDNRYNPDKEGFVDAEFFNLDYSLSLYIYSHLCYFRDNCLNGHPSSMTFEQWKSIIDKMIEAFKLQITTDNEWNVSKNKRKKINYGMKLFIKYYNHLWY